MVIHISDFKQVDPHICLVQLYKKPAAIEQTRDVGSMLFQCWSSVVDGGSTLKLHWVHVSHDYRVDIHTDDVTLGFSVQWPAPMAHSYRLGLVTWGYQVRIPVGTDICHRDCAYIVL